MFIQENRNCEGTEKLSKSTRSAKSREGLWRSFFDAQFCWIFAQFCKKTENGQQIRYAIKKDTVYLQVEENHLREQQARWVKRMGCCCFFTLKVAHASGDKKIFMVCIR